MVHGADTKALATKVRACCRRAGKGSTWHLEATTDLRLISYLFLIFFVLSMRAVYQPCMIRTVDQTKGLNDVREVHQVGKCGQPCITTSSIRNYPNDTRMVHSLIFPADGGYDHVCSRYLGLTGISSRLYWRKGLLMPVKYMRITTSSTTTGHSYTNHSNIVQHGDTSWRELLYQLREPFLHSTTEQFAVLSWSHLDSQKLKYFLSVSRLLF